MGEPVFSKASDPLSDLGARILREEPAQFCAVSILQSALDDGGRISLQIQAREVVFLEERSKGGWDGWHGVFVVFTSTVRIKSRGYALNEAGLILQQKDLAGCWSTRQVLSCGTRAYD
jgi:hypothetical protein